MKMVERRHILIAIGLAMGLAVALLWDGDLQASILLSDSTDAAGSPSSSLSASRQAFSSKRLPHAGMLQAAGDRLHVLAERGESLLKIVTGEQLEEACSEQEQWGQFCKNRAEDEDYSEKWEAFCSKKLAPTSECEQEKRSQHELKKIHEGLIKSCQDIILHYRGERMCDRASPQDAPECQVAFCKQLLATEHEFAAAVSPSPTNMTPAPGTSECDTMEDLEKWLQCEEMRRSTKSSPSAPEHVSLSILRLWTWGILHIQEAQGNGTHGKGVFGTGVCMCVRCKRPRGNLVCQDISTPCDGSGIEKGADDVFVKCAGLLPEKKDDPICNENEDDPDCVHFRKAK